MKSEYFEKMLEIAKGMRKNAYCKYSNFAVGSCVRDDQNKLYPGCNVENVSYGLTTCAETNAISNMIINGGKKILECVVIADTDKPIAPCGACRQRLLEFCNPDSVVYLCNVKGDVIVTTMQEMLPYAFDSDCLEKK